MRITHVIVGLNVGGAELMLQRLILAHEANPSYEHSVVSLTDLGYVGVALRSVGVKVTVLGMRSAIDFPKTYLLLYRELERSKPDIVQTWMYHSDLLGGLASRAAGIRNVVWGIRTTEIKAGGARTTLMIRKVCAYLSPYIPRKIVCAAESARAVHEDIGYTSNKMEVIPNGFALEKLVATPDQIAEVRREAGFTDGLRVIGSVGRFNAVKDQLNFVQAAGHLASRYQNLRFFMVGRGLDKSNAQLVRWIEETGKPECFVLFGERSDVPACLAAMDVFCLHSRTEGFPNVLGEAMAMAKVCVATDVGDAAFLIGDAGVIVPKENSLALAEGVDKLLTLLPLDFKALGVAAQQRIHTHFTMEHARKRYERLYQNLMHDDV